MNDTEYTKPELQNCLADMKAGHPQDKLWQKYGEEVFLACVQLLKREADHLQKVACAYWDELTKRYTGNPDDGFVVHLEKETFVLRCRNGSLETEVSGSTDCQQAIESYLLKANYSHLEKLVERVSDTALAQSFMAELREQLKEVARIDAQYAWRMRG